MIATRVRILALAGVLVGMGGLVVYYTDAYEHVDLMVRPSAQKYYSYGSRHFDARTARAYDVERAKALFIQALALDSEFPHAHHQLARIAFLEGDFQRALRHINWEIDQHGGPSAFYVRGLIYGFMGEYEKAAADYRTYLKSDPTNWAATNDLAWVLLKDERYDETLTAIDAVLHLWPENPWLHNSRATALFELGRFEEALAAAQKASRAAESITEKAWQQAYPGNDPLIAKEGVAALQGAIRENIHTIEVARASEGVDVP